MKKIYLLILLNAFLFGCNKKEPCNNEGISQVRDIKQEILDLVPYCSKPIALLKRTTFEKDKIDIINRIKTENSDFAKIYD